MLWSFVSSFSHPSKTDKASVENAKKYVLACLALHNYLRLTDNAHYTPAGLIDLNINMETLSQENGDHKIKMQFSLVAFKVSMLFEVPDQVLMR